MVVKILVSKPWTNRPKMRLAIVDGCSFFFRKGETETWKHAGMKACAHIDAHFPLVKQDDGSMRRQPGEKLDAFVAMANEAIPRHGIALAMAAASKKQAS